MKIKSVAVGTLVPYVNNSRTHSETQINQLVASITEFGWTNPILVDGDKGIIAGHGRLMAAIKMGMETVPVIELTHLSETQKRALIIADNKLALNADWDTDFLKMEISALAELGFDSDILGFTQGEITTLFLETEEGETDADEEWKGMPEFDQQDELSFRKMIVHFECQADVDEFARLIGQTFTDKTKSIWHPKQINMDTESKRYGDE